jgi:hypothetical protein
MTPDLPPPKKATTEVVIPEKCLCGCGLTLSLCERREHVEARLARATQRIEALTPRTPPPKSFP